jgi:hypothetical protein
VINRKFDLLKICTKKARHTEYYIHTDMQIYDNRFYLARRNKAEDSDDCEMFRRVTDTFFKQNISSNRKVRTVLEF